MFSRLRNFVQRHQRKFLVAGILVGGGILLKKYAERKLIEWQEREMNKLLERSRKHQHFESTERTCNMTISSVVPQLQSALGKSLDSDSITLLLKQKAPNKKELWEQLKVIAFSRIISYIYGNTILTVLLRTQVNVLGASLYLSNQNPSQTDLELSPESQSRFLSASNHWLSVGVEQFSLLVEKIVASKLANTSLKERLTLVDVERILLDINTAVNEEIICRPDGSLSTFMIPETSNHSSTLLDKMLQETREILDSNEVKELLEICSRKGVTCVLDKLSESVAAFSCDIEASSDSNDFVHPNSLSVYVAKLIPVLNNFIFQDVWPMQLITLEPLRVFGANIYDAFSNHI